MTHARIYKTTIYNAHIYIKPQSQLLKYVSAQPQRYEHCVCCCCCCSEFSFRCGYLYVTFVNMVLTLDLTLITGKVK